MPDRPNATQALLDRTLNMPLRQYATTHRKIGWSWQRIADEVNERCGTTISAETLRRWFTPNAKQAA